MKYFTDKELQILNSKYGTACRLRAILLNIFNSTDYPYTDIGGLLFNSDRENLELFYKILRVNLEYINGKQILQDINKEYWRT